MGSVEWNWRSQRRDRRIQSVWATSLCGNEDLVQPPVMSSGGFRTCLQTPGRRLADSSMWWATHRLSGSSTGAPTGAARKPQRQEVSWNEPNSHRRYCAVAPNGTASRSRGCPAGGRRPACPAPVATRWSSASDRVAPSPTAIELVAGVAPLPDAHVAHSRPRAERYSRRHEHRLKSAFPR
jgi:hypothetical protein